MSSPRNQAKALTQQDCLADRCFQPETGLCEARGGGVLLPNVPTTLLDNWNTGTMLPLRRESRASSRQDCLAKRTFSSREGLREARSGGSFPTTLLDNWNTGTPLSSQNPLFRAAQAICLAGQTFAARCERGFGVVTFRFFKILREGQVADLPRANGFTG